MNEDKKVLACVDQSKYAESVADYATWAARRMQAPMELLHVIDRHPRLEAVQEHSGAIGLDAQENMAGKPQVQGPKQIEEARNVLEAVGFQVSMEVHQGEPQTVIAEAVKSQQCDLLVMGAYSHSPWRSLFVGSKTTDLLRSAAVPTLLLR